MIVAYGLTCVAEMLSQAAQDAALRMDRSSVRIDRQNPANVFFVPFDSPVGLSMCGLTNRDKAVT